MVYSAVLRLKYSFSVSEPSAATVPDSRLFVLPSSYTYVGVPYPLSVSVTETVASAVPVRGSVFASV